MRILAIEFSSARRSVAIVDGLRPAGQAARTEGRRTPAFALIEEALQAARLERESIECVAVGVGPGSYTGIRAAIAVAQGWQLARGTPLLGVSSATVLAAQAQAAQLQGRIHVFIDAQRDEFYAATYEIHAAQRIEEQPLRIVSAAEAIEIAAAGLVVCGPDLAARFPGSHVLEPDASFLGRLASDRHDFIPGDRLEPIYLRPTSFVKAPPPRVIP